MKTVALFASGSGSNAENIIKYFEGKEVNFLVYTNKANAGVLERAKRLNVPSRVFNRHEFYDTDVIINELKHQKVDWVVLAGFLWLVPKPFVGHFDGRIINIHPALLPNYGGKGMYGSHVHTAVHQDFLDGKTTETGITIHFVNENYDEGEYLLQAKCSLEKGDTPESIAQKVHALEYEHYPKVVEKLLSQNP